MRPLHFRTGGISPLKEEHEGKHLSMDQPIEPLEPGETVCIPLMQNIGAPCKATVTVGQQVYMGEQIGEPLGFVGAPIHASVSGRVKGVVPMLHVTGQMLPHIVIENDGKYEWVEKDEHTLEEALAMPPEELHAHIVRGGVVGAGGATFPTHVKLNVPQEKTIDRLLINGAECEPFITADYRLMLERAEFVVQGVKLIAHSLGLPGATIGIEDNKPKAIEAMQRAAKAIDGIVVAVLRTRYPQGSEKQLIQALTGRQVPSGKLPMDVGCVVCNVGTCYAVYKAVCQGKAMVTRIVSVTGAVKQPKNLSIHVGSSFKEAIDACGGYVGQPTKLLSGGPMMGVAQCDDSVRVVKGTSGILALDARYAVQPPENNCMRCGKCVEVCPMGLMPLMIDQAARLKNWERAESFLAMNCMECGSCTYICPSKRHLVQSIRLCKAELTRQKRAAQAAAQAAKEETK